MSKEFNGGIGSSKLSRVLEALESCDTAMSRLMKMLVQEEHLSSLYDPEKLTPGSQICGQVRAARSAVENAADALETQTNQATREMNAFRLKVEALRNVFDVVKVDDAEIGVPGNC